MPEPSSSIAFEDVPLEEARRMGRGPRMEPLLYDTLRQKLQALTSEATRIRLGPKISPPRMKRYLLAMARELGVPLTIRRVPGGVLFWRATDEDRQQARETAGRLHAARQHRTGRGRGRRRTSPHQS